MNIEDLDTTTPYYTLTLKSGAVYTLAENGAVLSRTVGPNGFDYSGEWRILGASTRFDSNTIVPLADIARDGFPRQGWIHDLDHGTHRAWGSPSEGRLARLTTNESAHCTDCGCETLA